MLKLTLLMVTENLALVKSENRLAVQYVVLGPRKSAMPLVRVFSENDKMLRRQKKYVE